MTNQKKQFSIVGMHCASCAKLIEKKLIKINGVANASVNYANETAVIETSKNISEKIIEDVIISAGYKVGKNIEVEKKKELKNLKIKVIVSSIIAIFVMFSGFKYVIFLALFTQVVLGFEFYQSLWSEVKNRSLGMNSLVAIGTTAAFIYGYYETSTAIIALILLGRFLEQNAKNHTSDAIKKLIALQENDVLYLKIGDLVTVKPGQKIATDGVIIEGYSYIDESMITGESIPAKKIVGQNVIGGTINKNGSFIFKVTKVGKDTMLSQIIKMVRDAQGSKAEIQRLVDLVSSYFIPAVLIIALVTFFVFGLANAIAVLVIACPCAMGLATPTAIMVAVGRGARLGILIKDVQTLETLNKIKTIVFDKTGTLTHGHPVLASYAGKTGTYKENLQIAASLEAHSSHPIAEAIKYPKLLKVTNFKNIEGQGIEGVINSKKYFLGKTKNNAIDLVLNNKSLATFIVEDQIKSGVSETISLLEKDGITSWMITGDNKVTAEKIAKLAGIKHIMAEVMPADKAKLIKNLKFEITNSQSLIGFVGDGVNDAPALASANVGIAMGTGTDVAIESAGITLLNKDFRSVLTTFNLSKVTMKVIKMNLVWAFGYNIILIPVAMFGLLNPMLAAGAMSLSSISVVLNSLRLNKIKI